MGLADIYDEMPRWESRLDDGVDDVLCERYFLSLRVNALDDHSAYLINHVCRKAEDALPKPDLYVILDVRPETAHKRLQLRSWPPSKRLPDLDHLQVLADRYLQAAGSIHAWIPNGDRGVLLLNGEENTWSLAAKVCERVNDLRKSEQAA